MSEVEKVYDWFIQDSLSNVYKLIGKSEKDMADCPCPIKQKIEGTERDRSTLPGIVKEINAAIDDGDDSGVFELKEELIEQIEIGVRRLVDRMTDGLHVDAGYDVRIRLNEGLRLWKGD